MKNIEKVSACLILLILNLNISLAWPLSFGKSGGSPSGSSGKAVAQSSSTGENWKKVAFAASVLGPVKESGGTNKVVSVKIADVSGAQDKILPGNLSLVCRTDALTSVSSNSAGTGLMVSDSLGKVYTVSRDQAWLKSRGVLNENMGGNGTVQPWSFQQYAIRADKLYDSQARPVSADFISDARPYHIVQLNGFSAVSGNILGANASDIFVFDSTVVPLSGKNAIIPLTVARLHKVTQNPADGTFVKFGSADTSFSVAKSDLMTKVSCSDGSGAIVTIGMLSDVASPDALPVFDGAGNTWYINSDDLTRAQSLNSYLAYLFEI